ncbi:threonine--tRNA ligase [Clostridium culturomicium]|uniref:threonine--tRNA ligase n=1 Tax=Clostridium culturomicium TaxID=1499683 RepID=UPI00058B3025|nr:threonine--tRNA ligase [Clostridium culturomicium]
MIKITLKDGSVKELEREMSILEIAKSISEGLARVATAGTVNGKTVDLRYVVKEDCELSILTFDDAEGKKAFRHTASHILAQAIKRLYPSAKLAIGPSIDNGFYYDIDVEEKLSNDDLAKIEAEMKKIVKENLSIESFVLPRAEAIALMKENDEPYKIELIEDLPEDEVISFYKQGEFVDLCAGPHLMSTKPVKAIKLTKLAGAYWRGNEKNKMLTRIYGTAFTKTAELEEYLASVEEAMKRDHNRLGRELKLFTTSEPIGQGLPILMPKGARVIQLLQRWVEDEEQKRGYLLTKTPLMAKNDLYKISGHWDHYKEGMFVLGDEEKDDEVFALRPMTCPFQFMVYKADSKSYRDLPLRYAETSTLFRNESSGEMHGLIRVRQFTISEGHLACRPDQLEDEFRGVVDLINHMLETLGLKEDISYRLSLWDENNKDKYIGEPEAWNNVQNKMREILNHLGIEYTEAAGEAAFYGPKLDLQIKNVHGKEDTIITAQIDFSLAERFGMTYTDKDGQEKYPYVIHRTSIGCYERTLALLIEKYAGAFPVWLAPVQVKLLPISEKYHDYADEVFAALKAQGIRVEADFRAEKIGYKIREARNERVPYLIVVGEKEAANREVAVRSRKNGDEGAMSLESFIERVVKENDSKER